MRTKVCSHCGTINAAGAKDCKDCGEPFRISPSPEQQSSMCAWTDAGQRCYEPGTFSDSLQGGGPWYCRRHEHMRLGRGDPGYRSVETAEQRYERRMRGVRGVARDEVRASILGFLNGIPAGQNRKWAIEILERFAERDTTLPEMALRFACEALGVDTEEVVRQRREAECETVCP